VRFLALDPFTWLLVFMRISAFLAVFPVFSMRNFPVQLRVALGVLIAGLVTPLVTTPAVIQNSFASVVGLMIVELLVGLLLGFITRLLFFALDLAGGLVAVEIGLTFTPNPDPLAATDTQTPGLLLFLLAVMLLFSLDLHHWLLMAFQRSYLVAPIGGIHLREPLLKEIIYRSSGIFETAVQMAAPLMAVSFIITLTFAILARAVPHMNVFFESFAVRALVGLALFGLSINLMAYQMLSSLRRLPDDLLRVVQLLSGG
jgi:flagellar biosynthetic protein FliR